MKLSFDHSNKRRDFVVIGILCDGIVPPPRFFCDIYLRFGENVMHPLTFSSKFKGRSKTYQAQNATFVFRIVFI